MPPTAGAVVRQGPGERYVGGDVTQFAVAVLADLPKQVECLLRGEVALRHQYSDGNADLPVAFHGDPETGDS
jgi:hypothetical protein